MEEYLWNYLNGYVKISVEGLCLENFLNAVAKKQIRLFDVVRIEYKIITCSIAKKDFSKLRKILRDSNCRLKVQKRKGLAFAVAPAKRRAGLVFGALAFVIALIVASQFVWSVEVEGNETISKTQIVQSAKNEVRVGKKISKIDLEKIKAEVENKNPKVAWAGARINGTKITINIIEAKQPPQLLQQNVAPSSIVARKDALICEITTQSGTETAAVGEMVKAGTVIISGVLSENQNAPQRFVESRGSVMGNVWYKSEYFVPKKTFQSFRTGKFEDVVEIEFMENSYIQNPKFEIFEAEKKSNYNTKNFFLPLKVETTRAFEIVKKETLLSVEMLKLKSEHLAIEQVLKQIPHDANILEKTTNFHVTQEGVRAVCVAKTYENIGETINLDQQSQQQNNVAIAQKSEIIKQGN